MPIKHILFKSFLLLFVFFASKSLFAINDTIDVTEITSYIKINEHIRVFHTPKNKTVNEIYDLIKTNQITESQNKTSPGFSKDFFWLTFSFYNNTKEAAKLILELDNPHIDKTILFEQIKNDSFLLLGYGGDRLKFYDRTIINRRYIFNITVKPGETTDYYGTMLFVVGNNKMLTDYRV